MAEKKFDNIDQMIEFWVALERYKILVSLAMMVQMEVKKHQQLIQSFSQILNIPCDKELKFDFKNLTVSWGD